MAKGLSDIVSIEIGDGVTSIGENAFRNCSQLHNVSINSSVMRVKDGAFVGLGGIEEINYDGRDENALEQILVNKDDNGLGKYTIISYTKESGRETKTIQASGTLTQEMVKGGENKWWYDNQIEFVKIGSDVTDIEPGAFYGCTSLKSIDLGTSITELRNKRQGDGIFNACGSLEKIYIPDQVTKIDMFTFFGCSNLKDIYLGDGITTLDMIAFFGMSDVRNFYTKSQRVADLVYNTGYSYDSGHTMNIYINGEFYKSKVHYYSCFVKGTQITMADGTRKPIEELKAGDELKVFDFDKGRDSTAPIFWMTRSGLMNNHYYKLTFSDGSVLKTTGQNSNHKVYNVDERFFKGVNKTEIGDRIWSENGIVTVTNKEYIEEEVEYYNLMTSKKIDCYAEGILAADRFGNLYPIDENMKYIKEGRTKRPFTEFSDAGISRFWYDNLRVGESTYTIEEIKDYIVKCESQM